MVEVLFVKFGKDDSPITIKMGVDEVERAIGLRKLRYIGPKLIPIGETSPQASYAGPDHVILKLSTTEAVVLDVNNAGYCLVEDLRPSDITTM